MLSQKEYHENLIACRLDHLNFVDMNQPLTGKVLVEMLADKFEIFFVFKGACALLTPKKCSLPHLPHYMAHLSICLPYFPKNTTKNASKRP